MKLSTFFSLTGFVALLFGLATLLVPAQMNSFYGYELPTAGLFQARLLGGALIGLGLIAFQVRNAAKSQARDAIVLAFFISNAIGFFVTLMGQLSGEFNTMGWSTVAIYFLFTVGYAYFQFSAPSEG